jgi:two-component system sensor histidine kinase VanS
MLTATNERNIQIVEGLLALAAADQVPHDTEPVDMAELVESVAAEVRTSTSPTISVHASATDYEVRGNATLLRQMVANIIGNAAKHNIPDPAAFVSASLRYDGQDSVLLEVSNSGPAVGPTTTDRLFEPFYRATPRVDSERGHGLGLALVRSVTHAHGGTVSATARAGGGLVVHVRLPSAWCYSSGSS